MFVSRNRLKKLERENFRLRVELTAYESLYKELRSKWNNLVRKINAKGGSEFLDGTPTSQFSEDDLRRLLQLCHPDKHGGSKLAQEMTTKLNRLRS